MLEFLHSVMEWIQSFVQSDRNTIYQFNFDPKGKVIRAKALEGDVSELLDEVL